ncbi:YdcF family protein [Larkinella sp. VNQ87]|uniref:YdcF family protein n=1 Tax=Larkinella sp. VNQ87 TaxID=3400921 RepID=UPI003C033255
MFYFLSKTLTFLFMPMGLIAVALLFALLTKNRARQRKALIGATLLLFIGGNGFITNELARWWEVPPTVLPARTSPRVGVVLTGGLMKTSPELQNRLHLSDQADRVGQALLLYKTGQIQKILISGGIGGIIKRKTGDEGHLSRQFLIIGGVRAEDIVLENKSINTYENARFSAPVLRQQFSGYEVVLITSGWHMRRAIGCFEKQAVSVTPFPAAPMASERQYAPNHLLFPSEGALHDSYWILHELVGFATYRIMGYL